MKKFSLINARLFTVVMLVAATVMSLLAADVPSVTMFYPAQRDDNPMELKPTMKAYIYFETGSKVKQNKARIVQDGNVVGTCVYVGSEAGATTTTMDPYKAENADLAKLQAGLFTLEIYEVTYLSDGVEYTYSDESAPIASITYRRPATNGAVLSRTGISNNTIYSYYAVGGEDGLVVYTFDKPVLPDGIKAEFQYGMGEQYTFTKLDPVLSDDGLTLTIDLRGTCYNVDALAPGVTFVDDSGNPTDPPVIISLVVDHLNCADGTVIAYPYYSPDGHLLTTLEGQIWDTLNYVDQTFTTPYILNVYFYSSENPAEHYAAINGQTDMMGIIMMGNIAALKSFDLTLTDSKGSVKVEDYSYLYSTDYQTTFACKLPESVTSSNGLVISFDNVVFANNDGSEHVIAPWVCDSQVVEALTIADLKVLDEGTDCILYSVNGVKVTFASEEVGMMFAEDGTGGIIMSIEDYSIPFPSGNLVIGKIRGTYYGDGTFIVDPAASDYTLIPCDVTEGLEMMSVEEALSGGHNALLLTFVASEDMPIVYDEESEIILIDGTLPVVTEFVPGFEVPAAISSVTGVLYNTSYLDMPMIIIRSQDDVVAGEVTPQGPVVNTIAELKAMDMFSEVSIQLTDAKVTYVNNENGMTIVEDETGAVSIYVESFEPFTSQGKAITALLSGMYYFDGMFVIDDSGIISYEETDVDVSKGSLLTLDEIADPDNAYRLVTVYNTDETPIVADAYALYVGDAVGCIDYFGALDDTEFPSEVESFTGIIIPQNNLYSVDDDDDWGDDWGNETQMIIVAPRSAEDIVAKLTSIGSIDKDADAPQGIYNILGIRSANGDAKTLRPGFYIINGKKVYIK